MAVGKGRRVGAEAIGEHMETPRDLQAPRHVEAAKLMENAARHGNDWWGQGTRGGGDWWGWQTPGSWGVWSPAPGAQF